MKKKIALSHSEHCNSTWHDCYTLFQQFPSLSYEKGKFRVFWIDNKRVQGMRQLPEIKPAFPNLKYCATLGLLILRWTKLYLPLNIPNPHPIQNLAQFGDHWTFLSCSTTVQLAIKYHTFHCFYFHWYTHLLRPSVQLNEHNKPRLEVRFPGNKTEPLQSRVTEITAMRVKQRFLRKYKLGQYGF